MAPSSSPSVKPSLPHSQGRFNHSAFKPKNVSTATSKDGAKTKGGPSAAKPLPFWAKRAKNRIGDKTAEASAPGKTMKDKLPAPIRKTFVVGSGTQIRSKFGSHQQPIRPKAGPTSTTGEKRAHNHITDDLDEAQNSSGASGTPKSKKKRLGDPGNNVVPPSKSMRAQPVGTMPHFSTATQLAEFIFKPDAEDKVLPRHIKLRVCSILTVPGVTMDVYLNRLASSPEFKNVTQMALKIFRGELPMDEITTVAFIIANPKRLNNRTSEFPEADIWYKAQLQMGLEAEEIRSWENNPIFRAYRRVLRYLQQCSTGRLHFEPELGVGLLQDAREISRMPTKKTFGTTEMTKNAAEGHEQEAMIGCTATADSRVEKLESIKAEDAHGATADKATTCDTQSWTQKPL